MAAPQCEDAPPISANAGDAGADVSAAPAATATEAVASEEPVATVASVQTRFSRCRLAYVVLLLLGCGAAAYFTLGQRPDDGYVKLTVLNTDSNDRSLRPLPMEAVTPRQRVKIMLTLTTTIERLSMVNCTLHSLLRQTHPADEIALAVPWKSRRFNKPYPEPNLTQIVGDVSQYSTRIRVVRGKDYGPGTKFIISILRELNAGRLDTIIIVADDDVIYPKTHVEDLLRGAELVDYKAAVGLRGWCVHPQNLWDWSIMKDRYYHGSALNSTSIVDVDVITANNGLLVLPRFFQQVSIEITNKTHKSAFFMDDIWINGILAKNKIRRVVVASHNDPQHRGWVERRSHSLESVPGGRSHHNRELMEYFDRDWSHCKNVHGSPPTERRRELLKLCVEQ